MYVASILVNEVMKSLSQYSAQIALFFDSSILRQIRKIVLSQYSAVAVAIMLHLDLLTFERLWQRSSSSKYSIFSNSISIENTFFLRGGLTTN